MAKQVVVGRFGSPYGIKGWIKVISFTDPIDHLLDYLPWTIIKDKNHIILEKVKGKVHGKNLVVQLERCHDREMAQTFTNLDIYIDRKQLPTLSNEEYYWIDLIGLKVINQEQQELGIVKNLFAMALMMY